MKLLALDYGQKRTGVAVTDDMQIIASGLKTVETPTLLVFLKEYLAKNKVETIVIGQPKYMDGKMMDVEQHIIAFIEKLKAQHPDVPVERVDERFTSKMAMQTMIDGGLKKKDRGNKALVDEISATLILQSYMESRNNR
ncbi:MAG: Holliday junction resolvase RuvX [Bacteroidota bacterium]